MLLKIFRLYMSYFLQNSDAICMETLEEGKELCNTSDVEVVRQERKMKMSEEITENVGLTTGNEIL